ncbi:MAG: DEAD/DEAH box helicase, partial [Acidobacteriaceae bacterium]
GAGPFRSLGRLSVRPRAYQFVPLILALRLDPCVRMLIADDVGIGKTIEAGLIAREMLDRGDALRLCVLCPPHLCDQWQAELAEKFHIYAKVVRTSTEARLVRDLPRRDLSIYEYYPHIIVSIDYAKRDSRRGAFLSHCPDLVIVDEAHTAAEPGGASSRAQQQRHELIRNIAQKPDRHLVLLTATPHSGIEASFRSLLGLINEKFANFDVQQLTEPQRKALARQFVQRTRGDVVTAWPGQVRFPKRISEEATYSLSSQYGKLFTDVLDFTRETVKDPTLSKPRQRVRAPLGKKPFNNSLRTIPPCMQSGANFSGTLRLVTSFFAAAVDSN